MKCCFEYDTDAIYITPLIGYSNIKGKRNVWIGWWRWLWTFELKNYGKKCLTN
jgi:hypothetical protein